MHFRVVIPGIRNILLTAADLLQGFYDRSKLFWKDIDDTMLVAACAPPGNINPLCWLASVRVARQTVHSHQDVSQPSPIFTMICWLALVDLVLVTTLCACQTGR